MGPDIINRFTFVQSIQTIENSPIFWTEVLDNEDLFIFVYFFQLGSVFISLIGILTVQKFDDGISGGTTTLRLL